VNTDQFSTACIASIARTDAGHAALSQPGLKPKECFQRGLRRIQLGFRTLAWLLLSVLLLSNTQAALLFYEGFNYPNGEQLGESVVTSPPWENDKDQFTIASGNLDYTRLPAAAGNHLNVVATSLSLDSVRTTPGAWAAQSSGTLYVSFLLKIVGAEGIESTGDGTPVLTISKTSNNTELLGINLLNNGGVKLGVLKYPSNSAHVSSAFFSSGPGANLPADGSATCLIVAKYEWVEGATNDVVTVWLNPDGLGVSEDPANKVFTSAGADGTQAAGRLTLCRGPHLNIDEIRLGQNWAEVTTAAARKSAEADTRRFGKETHSDAPDPFDTATSEAKHGQTEMPTN